MVWIIQKWKEIFCHPLVTPLNLKWQMYLKTESTQTTDHIKGAPLNLEVDTPKISGRYPFWEATYKIEIAPRHFYLAQEFH